MLCLWSTVRTVGVTFVLWSFSLWAWPNIEVNALLSAPHGEGSNGKAVRSGLSDHKYPPRLSFQARNRALKSRWQRHIARRNQVEKTHNVPVDRERRSTSEESQSEDYTSFQIDLTKCGMEKSCVRFGDKDCVHGECIYIFTFKRIGDLMELELSAKTQGWVAVGFSSDRKMGGDEVIACIHNIVPAKVRAASMKNVIPHEKPRPQSLPLNLTNAEYKDGFTSCRVRRAITVDGGMDLTNDWYQLYAWGNVGSSGGMMRHELDKPPTSHRSHSIIQKNMNIMRSTVGSAARHQISAIFLVILAAFICY